MTELGGAVVLVVGASGVLGAEIARLLEDSDDRVDVPLTIVQPGGESAYAKRKRLMAESGEPQPTIAPFDTEAP